MQKFECVIIGCKVTRPHHHDNGYLIEHTKDPMLSENEFCGEIGCTIYQPHKHYKLKDGHIVTAFDDMI